MGEQAFNCYVQYYSKSGWTRTSNFLITGLYMWWRDVRDPILVQNFSGIFKTLRSYDQV